MPISRRARLCPAQGRGSRPTTFHWRDADNELGLVRSTVEGLRASAADHDQTATNAAIAPRTDVLQAQTQLAKRRAPISRR